MAVVAVNGNLSIAMMDCYEWANICGDTLLFGERVATFMITGIRRGFDVLLGHRLYDLLGNELKNGSLQHICLRVSLQSVSNILLAFQEHSTMPIFCALFSACSYHYRMLSSSDTCACDLRLQCL